MKDETSRNELVELAKKELKFSEFAEDLFNKVKLAEVCERAVHAQIEATIPKETDRVKQAMANDLFQALVQKAFALSKPSNGEKDETNPVA